MCMCFVHLIHIIHTANLTMKKKKMWSSYPASLHRKTNSTRRKKESKLTFWNAFGCQGLDYSLQSNFVCDVQDLLQSLQWNGNSTVVSLSHLSMWYFLHQHVNPVKKEFKLSFPAVKLLCFGAVLAVWGMCQSPPWSLSHLKISSPLWGLCGRGISPYCENHSVCFCGLHLLQLHAVRHYVFII